MSCWFAVAAHSCELTSLARAFDTIVDEKMHHRLLLVQFSAFIRVMEHLCTCLALRLLRFGLVALLGMGLVL